MISTNKKLKTEKVIVETVAWRKASGEPGVTLSVDILDNVFVPGRELVLRNVERLTYDYDPARFNAVCQKYVLSNEERGKLKALIFLNSGYVTQKLLRKHSIYDRPYEFGEVGNHYRNLVEALYKAKQAVPPPRKRRLYNLASYKKPRIRLRITRGDIKDVLQVLGISLLVFTVLFLLTYF